MTPEIRAASSASAITDSAPARPTVTSTTSTPTTSAIVAPAVGPTGLTLSKSDKSLMLARARDQIYHAMIVDDAVPIVVKRDEMVKAAIDKAMCSVTTDGRVQAPSSAKKDVIGAMSALWWAFKQGTFYQVNREFGLRLEGGSATSRIEHRRERVKYLLTNFNFLRDPLCPETDYFSFPFFQYVVFFSNEIVAVCGWS